MIVTFTREHTRCQGQREYGWTPAGARWAACPCGAYLEVQAFRWEEATWPNRLIFLAGVCYGWLERSLARLVRRAKIAIQVTNGKNGKLGGRPRKGGK